MQIKVSNLNKEYNVKTVLNDVSFTIDDGDKVGLTGYNGTGKSTLLKILSGEVSYTDGSVTGLKGVSVGYMPQDILDIPEGTVHEYLSHFGMVQDYQMEQVLNGLNLQSVALSDNVHQLSSGQKSKVFLAKILLAQPDLLLLDEPTNNLDMKALRWLEQFLANTKSTCIIISHDRKFLDTVISKVLEINWHSRGVHMTTSKYSDYLESKKIEYYSQLSIYQEQEKERSRLTVSVEKKRQYALAGEKYQTKDNDKQQRDHKRNKSAKSSSVMKSMVKRKERAGQAIKPLSRESLTILMAPSKAVGNTHITMQKASLGYSGKTILADVSLSIPYGSRVVLLGDNGVGKSTILKTVSSELSPLTGTVEVGNGLMIGNLTQEHQNLPLGDTFLTFFKEHTNLPTNEVFSLARKFGFSEFDVRKKLGELSPGGKARALFALSSAQSVNTLLLDEPTNHLDLEALIAIEDVIESFTGTILLVSHDRYFLEKFKATHLYLVEGGKVKKIDAVNDYILGVSQG